MCPDPPDLNRSSRGAIRCLVPLRPRKSAMAAAYVHTPGNHRLGVAYGGNGRQVIALAPGERKAHTHIMGGSGRGKSYFLQQLIRQDFDDPDCGLCLLDPHGSLYRPLVRYLAEQRPQLADRVVLFDPTGGSGHIPGFNPIGPYALEHPEYTLNMLVDACLKAWRQDRSDRTPRITRQLENIFALIIVNGLTLLETVPLISTSRHSEKRALMLAALDHELIRAEWEEFELASATVRQQLLEGAGNRLRKFLSSAVIRQVLGQQEHVLDMDRIVAEKKILLVNLSAGPELSRENANLLGIMMINELFRVAMLRNPDANPDPFHLYIDEFAQLITPTVANILDECRKYGLFLTLAHQHLKQLQKEDEWLLGSILTNCHNRFVFGGLEVSDAELLAKQLYTGFEDLKQVKHTEWQTKFRPVEETRVVRSRSTGLSRGKSAMFTEACGKSTALSHSFAESASRGKSRALARSTTRGTQETRGASLTLSSQQGGQHSDSTSEEQGQTRTRNWSDGQSEQNLQGGSSGEARQQGTQRGRQETVNSGRNADPHGTLITRQQNSAEGETETDTASESTSLTRNYSHTQGESHQEGGGASLTTSAGKSRSDGTSWGRGKALGASRQTGASRSTGVTATETASETATRTVTDGKTETTSRQRSLGQGQSETASEGESESVVPFLNPQEFQEAHQTFWTLQEIEFMRTGQIKEQPVGVATMKIGAAAPQQVKIDPLPPFASHGAASEQQIAALQEHVARTFPEYYATPAEIQAEIGQRQLRVFGEVMRLELKPARLGLLTNGDGEQDDAIETAAGTVAVIPANAAAGKTPPPGGRFTDDDDNA